MEARLTAKQVEQVEAKQFLDFVDLVSTALYGRVFEDLATYQQRSDVLSVVEQAHTTEVN